MDAVTETALAWCLFGKIALFILVSTQKTSISIAGKYQDSKYF